MTRIPTTGSDWSAPTSVRDITVGDMIVFGGAVAEVRYAETDGLNTALVLANMDGVQAVTIPSKRVLDRLSTKAADNARSQFARLRRRAAAARGLAALSSAVEEGALPVGSAGLVVHLHADMVGEIQNVAHIFGGKVEHKGQRAEVVVPFGAAPGGEAAVRLYAYATRPGAAADEPLDDVPTR